MSLPWYPVHVDRLFGSRRWRAVDGNAKGLYSNLMHLAASTGEGRRTGRLVTATGGRPISDVDLKEEFRYPRIDRMRALLGQLLDVGLAVRDEDDALRLPRFPALVRLARRYAQKANGPRKRHGKGTIPDEEETGRSSRSKDLDPVQTSREPEPEGDVVSPASSDVRSGGGAATSSSSGASRPDFRRLRKADLVDLSTLFCLRPQLPTGFPTGTHGDVLLVSCALHAVRNGHRPAALFRSLVDPTKTGWARIPDGTDAEAGRILAAFRRGERRKLIEGSPRRKRR